MAPLCTWGAFYPECKAYKEKFAFLLLCSVLTGGGKKENGLPHAHKKKKQGKEGKMGVTSQAWNHHHASA